MLQLPLVLILFFLINTSIPSSLLAQAEQNWLDSNMDPGQSVIESGQANLQAENVVDKKNTLYQQTRPDFAISDESGNSQPIVDIKKENENLIIRSTEPYSNFGTAFMFQIHYLNHGQT